MCQEQRPSTPLPLVFLLKFLPDHFLPIYIFHIFLLPGIADIAKDQAGLMLLTKNFQKL